MHAPIIENSGPGESEILSIDVQTVLTIIGNRNVSFDDKALNLARTYGQNAQANGVHDP